VPGAEDFTAFTDAAEAPAGHGAMKTIAGARRGRVHPVEDPGK
jgi:hypothetical protein